MRNNVKNSNIIGHAQNAAGSFNQAKANEVDALTKYEEEIEKNISGEKQDYIGNLKLNTKYYSQGIENPDKYTIFYSDGTAVSYYAYLTSDGTRKELEEKLEYTIEDNMLVINGEISFELVKLEKNDLIVMYDSWEILSTSNSGLNYLKSGEYVCGNKYIILREDEWEVGRYVDGSRTRNILAPYAPILYQGVIWGTSTDFDNDGVDETMTSTDNGETIILLGEVYTKVVE